MVAIPSNRVNVSHMEVKVIKFTDGGQSQSPRIGSMFLTFYPVFNFPIRLFAYVAIPSNRVNVSHRNKNDVQSM